MKINVEHSFTEDRQNYWDKFPEHIDDLDDFKKYPTKLIDFIIKLYGNKKLPYGDRLNLKYEKIPDFGYELHYNNTRFGSDSIIQIYWYWKAMQNLINNEIKYCIKEQEGLDFYDFIKLYLKKAHTIGGHIIFPKERYRSINVRRNSILQDRFDLTLECIRKYYKNPKKSTNSYEYNPLGYIINENYKGFFEYFDFPSFVDFFYLNPIVSNDYSSIKFFIERSYKKNEANFLEKSLPKSCQEWFELYNNQMLFLEERNNLIAKKNNTMQIN